MQVEIVPLGRDDWRLCRDLTLECLKREAWTTRVTYARKKDYSESLWRKACRNGAQAQAFALLVDGRLSGWRAS